MPGHISSKKRLSVCHIVSGDLWAGAEVQVFHLLNELRKNEHLHLNVIIHNEGELSARLRIAGVRVTVLNEKKLPFYQLVFKAMHLIRSENVDIIHSHRYKENWVAVLASRSHLKRPRLVQTVHGLSHPRAGAKISKMRIYAKIDAIFRRFFFDRVVAVSKELYYSLAEIGPSDRLRYIPNGIPHASAMLPMDKKCGQRTDAIKTIGVVGRLVAVKNVQAFLGAIPQMLSQRRNLNFLVVGDGPERESLKRLASDLGVEAHVEFTGHISDMGAVWPQIDIYVMCSLHEGLSIALLEAMAHGLAVVATAVGGNTEVVQHGMNGLLIPDASSESIANACLEIFGLAKGRARIIRQAAIKTVSDRYSSTACAQKYSDLYSELLDQGTPQAMRRTTASFLSK